MRVWFQANKVGILALAITIVLWVAAASVLPVQVVVGIQAFAFGWFFLGGVVQPWVEEKIKRFL